MRLRRGIGMARMSTLCHRSPLFASYIIYGNALGGRLAVPSVCIAGDPRWVGQALPLLGDRVAQSEELQAQRLQFERRLRFCDPEVATQSVFGIDRGFVIEGTAHGHERADRGYPLSAWDVVATANPFCDLPWVRRGRMSFKVEILPKAHDEKNARRGYQLL
jgi:hypothetical protein